MPVLNLWHLNPVSYRLDTLYVEKGLNKSIFILFLFLKTQTIKFWEFSRTGGKGNKSSRNFPILCMSIYITKTFPLVNSSISSKQLLFLVHSQGQKRE